MNGAPRLTHAADYLADVLRERFGSSAALEAERPGDYLPATAARRQALVATTEALGVATTQEQHRAALAAACAEPRERVARGRHRTVRRSPVIRFVDLLADLDHLRGEPAGQVAVRLHTTPAAIARTLHRHGLHDRAAPFNRAAWQERQRRSAT
jgi:hypothetical protein